MHLAKLSVKNVRSIEDFSFELKPDELAGWHVILGDNGSGKSSVIRSLALIFAGGTKISAARQTWENWLSRDKSFGSIEANIRRDEAVDQYIVRGRQPKSFTVKAEFERAADPLGRSTVTMKYRGTVTTAERTLWSAASGWFSASFGPFRRFSGGDREWDRLFVSPDYRRVAAHLSAFGEDVALTEALLWLQQLHVDSLEQPNSKARDILSAIKEFVNHSDFLPHGAKISDITSQSVQIEDGKKNIVAVTQMSDGYRSILSLTFELIRQMFLSYGTDVALKGLTEQVGTIQLPGVVAIDEVDAHLHPAWQAKIGDWFVERFPKVQFLVTTHSPIVCRAARRGSIWSLPTPGTKAAGRRVTGTLYDRLVSGNVLDAYGTDFFGKDVEKSELSARALDRIATLAKRQALGELTAAESEELKELRAARPTVASAFKS